MYGLEEYVQPIVAIYVLWLLWFLGLIATALWSSRSVKRQHPALESGYRVLITVGGLLMFGFHPWPGLDVQYLLWRPLNGIAGWLLVALTFAGFVFAFWARALHGASNTSGQNIIETGPYSVVRHPLYTGVIIAAFASAMVFGKPSSLAGTVLLTIAFMVKILFEEGVLRSETGRYDDYAERVPMLVPFLPNRLWGKRYTPHVAPSLPRAIEETPAAVEETPAAIEETPAAIDETPVATAETPAAIDLLSPALAAAPVAAGTQMSLPLASPVPLPEPATVPVSEKTADEPVAPAADEAPAQPALSEAMSITKR